MLTDLRYAFRMLRKSPGFTLVAAVAIALGSAAVTTIYSVVNAVLLESSPGVGHGDALITVQKSNRMFHVFSVLGYPLYRDLRNGTRTLDGLAAFTEQRVDVGLTDNGAREAVAGLLVSGNYFDVLQVRPAAGRFFLPDEDKTPLSHPVAVISWRMWHDRFNESPSAIGQRISLQARQFTIVGVAPREFNGTTAMVTHDIYVPLMMTTAIRHDDGKLLESRGSGWLGVIGRLKPGFTAAVAQGELAAIARRAEHDAASIGGDQDVDIRVARLRPIPANGVTVVAIFLSVLMVVAGLVLTIAAINVASMLLARGITRRREFAVRIAIGAGRARLVRQLLTESVLLFLIGGTGGVLLAFWVTRLVSRIQLNVDIPVAVDLPIDGRVLAFTLLTSLASGLVFGLIPALRASRHDLATVLRSEGAGAARRERTRGWFVTVQLAMSVLLLVAAGLFVRAFDKGRTLSPGYDIDHVVVAPISLLNAGYDSTQSRTFYRTLTERLRRYPGVESVSLSNMTPLSTSMRATGIDIPGVQPPNGMKHLFVPFQTVGPDFFRVIRLPVRRGRAFDASDTPTSAPVAVVTEAFAKHYWPKSDAIGKTFSIGGQKIPHRIVGVVGDGRFIAITNDPEPFMFLSDAQDYDADLTVFMRTAGDPSTILDAVAHEVNAIDPLVTAPKAQTLVDATKIGLLPQRIAASVTAVLGAVGLVLATLGLYGVVAYGVGERTREIGIRMALGAEPGQMVQMVIGEGARFVVWGTGAGMLIAMIASRVLTRFLFGVSPLDPVTLTGVPVLLATVALLASWLPARRAAAVELATAMRD